MLTLLDVKVRMIRNGKVVEETMKLPAYTAEDEGKVLAVNVNGELIWANQGVKYIESLDENNIAILRNLDSGTYVLYGYFKDFEGSNSTRILNRPTHVNVYRANAGSHIQCIYPLNNQIQFMEILVDETNEYGYTVTENDIHLNELVSRVAALEESISTE